VGDGQCSRPAGLAEQAAGRLSQPQLLWWDRDRRRPGLARRRDRPARVERRHRPHVARAVAVLLDAIAASDGSRASVTAHLLSVNVRNGIIGSFRFDRSGDPTFNPVMIFRVQGGKVRFDRLIAPPPSLVG
jgi:hypothetical protein